MLAACQLKKGGGARLWPASKEGLEPRFLIQGFPKHFLNHCATLPHLFLTGVWIPPNRGLSPDGKRLVLLTVNSQWVGLLPLLTKPLISAGWVGEVDVDDKLILCDCKEKFPQKAAGRKSRPIQVRRMGGSTFALSVLFRQDYSGMECMPEIEIATLYL